LFGAGLPKMLAYRLIFGISASGTKSAVLVWIGAPALFLQDLDAHASASPEAWSTYCCRAHRDAGASLCDLLSIVTMKPTW